MSRASLLILLVGLAAVASACGSSRSRAIPRDQFAADSARVEAVRQRLAAATSPLDRQGRLAAALADAGLTPIADPHPNDDASSGPLGFSVPPVLGGIVPGRYPLLRPDLIVVVAREAALAPVVVEVGRLLALRAQTENEPRRSVLVAIAPAPAPLADLAALAFWPPESVREVWVVGGTDLLPDSLGRAAVHRVPSRPTLPAFATATARAVLRAANAPRPDTLGRRLP